MKIRIAAHVHSEWSYDGKYSLAEIAEIFGRRNYQAVLITEHDRGFDAAKQVHHRAACARASNERITLVPGIEYSDAHNCVHILTWGTTPFIGCNVPTALLLTRIAANRGVAVMAHPARNNAWRRFDPAWSSALSGIEIWNRKSDGWMISKEAARIARTSNLGSFVGMDFHDRTQLFPLAMAIEVDGALTEAAILSAIVNESYTALAFGRPASLITTGIAGWCLSRAERLRRKCGSIRRAALDRARSTSHQNS